MKHLDHLIGGTIFHLWFKRRIGFPSIGGRDGNDCGRGAGPRPAIGDVEYWQGRLWIWVRQLHESWGEEVSNEVLRTWIRELQGNEKKMKEKLLSLEVSKEILEEIKEWNQEKTRKMSSLEEEVKNLKGQVEELKALKAEVEVEEEVTNLKAEVKALKADVEAMKAKKPMKAWPVNPFVPT